MLPPTRPDGRALEGQSIVTLNERARGLNASNERVILVDDQETGLEAIIAIHSTARGPAFGGCRMKPHPSRGATLHDALRLSQAMSRKSAMAGLPFGGGKCVVIADPASQKSDALLLALAKAIRQLGDSYLTADGSGTKVRDMEIMRNVTPHARGLALPSGEACPAAAYGTFLALRVVIEHRLGRVGLTGVTVAVQGLGNLGMRLCAYLHEVGAKLTVADPQTERMAMAVRDFGASVVPVDCILSTPADVLSPNAFGDVICVATVAQIRAGIVVGGANNQLRTARHGVALHDRAFTSEGTASGNCAVSAGRSVGRRAHGTTRGSSADAEGGGMIVVLGQRNPGIVLSVGLAVAAKIAIQAAAGLSRPLVAEIGAPGVTWMRMATAAAVLLIITRPRLRGLDRRSLWDAFLLGAALSTMSAAYFVAVSRIPLGLAATIAFLGPFSVAVFTARGWRPQAFSLLAAVGVLL